MILTPEQEQIRDTLRTFAREQLAPNAAEWDKNSTFPREALRQLGELGVCGMVVPDEWGGSGLDYVSLALAMEEIAAGDGSTSTGIRRPASVNVQTIAAPHERHVARCFMVGLPLERRHEHSARGAHARRRIPRGPARGP